jgi:uncharacterized RDD family membrane protein YckC
MDSEFDNFDAPREGHVGRRVVAGLIDYILIFGATYAYLKEFGQATEEGYMITGLPALFPIVIWLSLTVILEQVLGATIGNGIAGLKPGVLHRPEKKISFGQSFLRHLADPLDMFFFGLVGVLTINNSVNKQRLGDIWAGTVVTRG